MLLQLPKPEGFHRPFNESNVGVPGNEGQQSSYNNNSIVMLNHRRRVSGTYVASLYAPSPRSRRQRLAEEPNTTETGLPAISHQPQSVGDGPWSFADIAEHRNVHYDDLAFVALLYADDSDFHLLRRFPNLVNLRDRDGVVIGGGETLLHRAVRARSLQATEALLRKRAHPWVVDDAGRSPLHLACAMGDSGEELAAALLRSATLQRGPVSAAALVTIAEVPPPDYVMVRDRYREVAVDEPVKDGRNISKGRRNSNGSRRSVRGRSRRSSTRSADVDSTDDDADSASVSVTDVEWEDYEGNVLEQARASIFRPLFGSSTTSNGVVALNPAGKGISTHENHRNRTSGAGSAPGRGFEVANASSESSKGCMSIAMRLHEQLIACPRRLGDGTPATILAAQGVFGAGLGCPALLQTLNAVLANGARATAAELTALERERARMTKSSAQFSSFKQRSGSVRANDLGGLDSSDEDSMDCGDAVREFGSVKQLAPVQQSWKEEFGGHGGGWGSGNIDEPAQAVVCPMPTGDQWECGSEKSPPPTQLSAARLSRAPSQKV